MSNKELEPVSNTYKLKNRYGVDISYIMNKWHKAKPAIHHTYIKFNVRKTGVQWALDIYQGYGNHKDGGPNSWVKEIMYYTQEKGAIKAFNRNKKRWCE